MTNVQSKIVTCTCQEFVHPWTDSCAKSVAGFIIQGSIHSLKIYGAVYAVSLLLRRKIPSKDDLKKTIMGIIQSAAFLTANGAFFIGFMCVWRQIFGHWTFLGATFWPTFYASVLAYLIERPERRILLTMYVANEASETLWNILKNQGYVSSIANAQVFMFGVGMSTLFYLYKLGLHKEKTYKDPIFDIINLILGKKEEGPMVPKETEVAKNLLKHKTCNHEQDCVSYTVFGGLKSFTGGFSISVAFKLLSLLKGGQLTVKNLFLQKDIYTLGAFLGGFSFLFKGTSCLMRHANNDDKPEYAIVSALVASCAAFKYKSNFLSLYVVLKAIQLYYYYGCENDILPNIPSFQIILYSSATALLFHAAQYQPTALRPSYWKFLFALSGSRVALFNRHMIEKFGMKSYQSLQQTLKVTHTMGKPLLWPMV